MKECEIRPEKIFNKLLELNKEDIVTYFCNSTYKRIKCPACNNDGVFAFSKNDFIFDECSSCKTLYVSFRPDSSSFDKFYTKSKSSKYWASTFYEKTQESRREKLWKPKAKLVMDIINKYAPKAQAVIDIGGGYGVFIEEMLKLKHIDHLVIEPSKYLYKICKQKNLNAINLFLENINQDMLPDGIRVFSSFELFEHLHNPKVFLQHVLNCMQSGDLFVLTTLNGMGLDIQTLWEDSKAISPPMHLNFFNPKSISILLNKIGFEVLEVSTPGKLDIDIMQNNYALLKDRFWRNFIDYASDEQKNEMQVFISNAKLSSHMMVVCRKNE